MASVGGVGEGLGGGSAATAVREDEPLSLLRNGPLVALGIGHGAVDHCANVLPVFYPILASTLSLSYASVGVLTTVQALFSSLSQPLFGWLADRFGSRVIAPASVVLAAAAIAAAGFVGSYYALLAMVAMLGLAVGAYHPQGAKGATLLGGRWRTTALSIYMVFGALGFSSAPLLAAMVFVPNGLQSTPWLLLPASMVASMLLLTGRRVDRVAMARAGKAGVAGKAAIPWAGMAAAVSLIIARSWMEYNLIAFVPLLFAARGEPRELAGQILFVIFSAGALGTALGGWLADRVGRRAVAVGAFALLLPIVHFFLGATGGMAVVLAFLLGLVLASPVTLSIAAVQEALPTRMGMASGLAISSGMIMGGFGVSVHGLLADGLGLESSVRFLMVALVVGLAAGIALPRRQRRFA